MAKFNLDSKIYAKEIVKNKKRRFGSALYYYPAILEDEHGNEVPLLFTKHDLEVAKNRASTNLEDIPKKDKSGFLSWLFG